MLPLKQRLTNAILLVTVQIQNKFPALYVQLSETPLRITDKEKEINENDYRQYLESLTTQLATFEKRIAFAPVNNAVFFKVV